MTVEERVRGGHRFIAAASALLLAAAGIVVAAAPPAKAVGSSCGANVNPIACENRQDGTPQDVWDDVTGAGDPTIQGFATDISVNAGNTISFKIDTDARAYTIDIYRLGYYGGDGARHVASISPSAHLPQTQPACLTDPSVSLTDCGDWGVSASWGVPSSAVSGVYLADLTRTDTGGMSQITFIVRNDASAADIVYQTSDPTWEAYNMYGGAEFYTGSLTNQWDSPSRARKVSYNRPFATRGSNSGRDFLFSNEYPTIRFLEQNGYDVTYIAGVDTDRYGQSLLTHHKVFLSVGHDEYWSQAQRTNVEQARDAGVNLMFLSGNEIYWHTRYEPSIDGTNTPYRTLVCYKETWDNAATDPTGESTATWRDPRFSAKPGGGNPENALSGTAYLANDIAMALTVSKQEAADRIWRGTGLSSMSGSSTQLAANTVGYESDEDIDNGFRPAGLIDMSTTVGMTDQYLTDFGSTAVTAGTTTHHITLYRAASGALVFSAGTIQWAWGLDQDHDGTGPAADSRMQQATVNMLADMHAQPTTLMSGLVAATASTDTTAPTSHVTAPTAGQNIQNGTRVTVTGTASDTGGGVVAGVEVSLDGGKTWHPAQGTTSWSYTGVLSAYGPVTIKSRASDDSANTESPSSSVSVGVGCPCSIFGDATPRTVDSGDVGAYELGTAFTSTIDGRITGARFYKSAANTGTHTASLWTASGTRLATGTFTNETTSGWQTMSFDSPVWVTKGTKYVVSYTDPNGHYADDIDHFYYTNPPGTPLGAVNNGPNDANENGFFGLPGSFPSQVYQAANYYVDVVFDDGAQIPPTVVAQTPKAGATTIAVSTAASATFAQSIEPSTLTFSLKDPSGHSVPGTVSYDDPTKTATFTPAANLDPGTTYTAAVSASNTFDTAMGAPASWTFQTAFANETGTTCPCQLYPDSWTPAIENAKDTPGVTLGVQFSPDTDGVITGVRFYKGSSNTGTHIGSLWTSTGTLLATATFTDETVGGWQQVMFATPVAVSAGTTYVASYYTSAGYYSYTSGDLADGYSQFPLEVPSTGGRFSYSNGFPGAVSSSNYGVDAIFTVPASVTPSLVSVSPKSGTGNAPVNTDVTLRFSDALMGGTYTASLTDPDGDPVPGDVTLDATHHVLQVAPQSALATSTKYTVTVTGVRSVVGTLQTAPITSTFTTSASAVPSITTTLLPASAVPGTVDSGDSSAISLGVRFTSAQDGYVSGARFYKSAANTGTHTATLWSSTGTALATATFANETSHGWQTVDFGQPVPIVAGATYVLSYYAPNGHYSYQAGFFTTDYVNGILTAPGGNNGVFGTSASSMPALSYNSANYWVDPIVTTGSAPVDGAPPTVTSSTPAAGATGIPVSSPISATFSEPISEASLQLTVKDPSGTAVPGVVTYNGASNTATFAPGAVLAAGSAYSVSVLASDTSGNDMPAAYVWTFTTAGATACPCGLFASNAVPGTVDSGDPTALNLGVRLVPDLDGYISGVRFYKAATNVGTHVATLWDASGTALATATFSGESASGWQSVSFAPVLVSAGSTYVVSYSAPSGHYSYDAGFFTSAYANPPLSAPAGTNGVFGVGSASVFPNQSYNATNYWVDPIFMSGAIPVDTTPPVLSSVAAVPNSSTTATVSWTTDEAASTLVSYGTSADALGSSASGSGLSTAHSVGLSGLAPSTTYFYKVTSADGAGNSSSSATAGSFTTPAPPDTTPPVISAVTASGTATTATITWTTNESSTSSVVYGTSAASLNQNASASGLTTAHSVSVSGLTVNTRYYFRITSVDAAGNSATSPASGSPASYAPTTTPKTDTATADFAGGTVSSTYVTSDGDGGVVLGANGAVAEFSGTALPNTFTCSSVVSGGSCTVSGGAVTVSGANLTNTSDLGTGTAVEAQATLGPNQKLGLYATNSSSVVATFSVNTSNQLVVTVNDGRSNNVTSTIASGWTAAAHKYRVERTTSAVTFYVDDVQKYTRSYSPTSSLRFRAVFGDSSRTDARNLSVDWARILPYLASGTFTSKVFDAGAPVAWDGLSWDSSVPTGTTLTVRVRTGNTATPGSGWSNWTTVTTSGNAIGGSSRYVQYQLTLTTSGNRFVTPTIRSVSVAYHVA